MRSAIGFEEIVRFHGHVCPGLAMGYRMALAGLMALSERKAADEEVVAIVENDACGVDAVQVLTGCTFGKGNLIFRDYGKSVYTLYSRRTGLGVRVAWDGSEVPDALRDDREARVRWILDAPEELIVRVETVTIAEPPKARIQDSVRCTACGERVMATRVHHVGCQILCIPCREPTRRTFEEEGSADGESSNHGGQAAGSRRPG
jgi:formylmethanofuran dehydrogenase subunit E